MTIRFVHRGTPSRFLQSVALRRPSKVFGTLLVNYTLTLVLSYRSQTFPALFGLYNNGFLPKGIRVVGYARTKMDEEVRLICSINVKELAGRCTGQQRLQRHRWGRAHSALNPLERSRLQRVKQARYSSAEECRLSQFAFEPLPASRALQRRIDKRPASMTQADRGSLSSCRSTTSACSSTSRRPFPP